VLLDGVQGVGKLGILKPRKRVRGRSGGGQSVFKPKLFSVPPDDLETEAQALARWRQLVDDLLAAPSQAAVEEPDKAFAFLAALTDVPLPEKPAFEVQVEPSPDAERNWQVLALAEDLMLLGVLEADGIEAEDMLLLNDEL